MHKKTAQDKKISSRNQAPAAGKRPKSRPFRRKSPTAINDLLASRATLRQLSTVIAAQQDWLAWIRTQLPPELAPHVANAVAKGAELVVLAESAAWSTRLRYALAGLDEALTARDPTMTGFAVRVQPPAR